MLASELRVYHRLQLAAHRLRKLADRALDAQTGLTTAQTAVMSVLAQVGEVSQRMIAQELGLTESAVTPMAKRLVREGRVARRRSQTDPRAWALSLTAAGKNALKRSKTGFLQVNKLIESRLSPDEVAALATYLERLATDLEPRR